jgi:hypothetical protein
VQQYVQLYSGPELKIYSKYSAIINVVYTTFTYGLAIPIMFPLSILCLLSIYVTERIKLAKYYKEPPHYDIKLILLVLDILKMAPLPMFAFGYWFLGNR